MREPRAWLICRQLAARRKARHAAVAETLGLLHDLNPQAPPGGPLSDQRGVYWITVPDRHVLAAAARLPRLGYTEAVDLLVQAAVHERDDGAIRWSGRWHRLMRLYESDLVAEREQAPDRRPFLLEGADGQVREVRGYRGDGSDLGRRGLPVCDARLLINLTQPRPGAVFLDPFAGIGGLLIEAGAARMEVVSMDRDPAVRHGLRRLTRLHLVSDAARIPFADRSFDAVATEPPYHPDADDSVLEAIAEIRRLLKPGGRAALLCASRQAEAVRTCAASLGFNPILDLPIDRKGTPVVALAWCVPCPSQQEER